MSRSKNGNNGFSKLGAALLVGFLGVAVFSLIVIGVDSSNHSPSPSALEDSLYTLTAGYTHTAYLKPNIVYDNKTKLTGGSYAFLSLVKALSIGYQAEIHGASLNGTYVLKASIGDGETWEKTVMIKGPERFEDSFNNTLNINVTRLENIISMVLKETKTYSPSYQLIITARIQGTLRSGNHSRPLLLEVKHPITLDYSSNKLVFSATSRKISGMIGSLGPQNNRDKGYVLGSRITPYLLLVSSAGGMGAAYYALIARRKPVGDAEAEEEYKDIIVSGGEPPETPRRVEVAGLRELARIGVMLEKPVVKGPKTYYVLDGETLYTYTRIRSEEKKQ